MLLTLPNAAFTTTKYPSSIVLPVGKMHIVLVSWESQMNPSIQPAEIYVSLNSLEITTIQS